MAKFWKHPAFEALNREWTQRLKEVGFEDCEQEIKGEMRLKESRSSLFNYQLYGTRQKTKAVDGKVQKVSGHDHFKEESYELAFEKIESKRRYFELIAQFFSDERWFEDDSDRLIMQRTSEGWTIAEISKELRSLGKFKFNRDTIRYIRRRYENKWGVRHWKPEQMVSRKVPTR